MDLNMEQNHFISVLGESFYVWDVNNIVWTLQCLSNVYGMNYFRVGDFLHSGDEKFEEVMRKLRTRFIEERNIFHM